MPRAKSKLTSAPKKKAAPKPKASQVKAKTLNISKAGRPNKDGQRPCEKGKGKKSEDRAYYEKN